MNARQQLKEFLVGTLDATEEELQALRAPAHTGNGYSFLLVAVAGALQRVAARELQLQHVPGPQRGEEDQRQRPAHVGPGVRDHAVVREEQVPPAPALRALQRVPQGRVRRSSSKRPDTIL